MNLALQARVDMALARVFEDIDPSLSEQHRTNAYENAHTEGYQSEAVSPYFDGEPLLLKGHRDGVEENRLFDAHAAEQAEIFYAETEFLFGTEAEWDAMPDEAKASEWERFHELCAQGIGDEMYFYRVLMNKWLVGYGGH